MASGSRVGAWTATLSGILGVAILLPGALAQETASPDSPAAISFREEVKPIIERKCSGCHVNGGHAGGLQMDSFESLMRGGDDGAVVGLGDVAKSKISQAIHYEDPDLQMPPPPRDKLDVADIAAIDKWIKESSMPAASDAASASVAAATSAPVSAATPGAASAARVVTVGVVSAPGTPMLAAEQEQFFETKVRPILVNKCYMCHASASKGGLRLDSREGVLAGGKDGAVVVPGHPESSLLSSAIHYADTKLQMPPRKSLSPEEVAVLDQWIKGGVPWPKSEARPATDIVTAAERDFWSYKTPVRPEVPKAESKWVETDIDRFILAKLDEKKLKMGGDADKRTLLRRVTYDLTGLPPTPAEELAFAADRSPQAYEHVVDRLLGSKAYGERWGRIWLDVVRYADTTGGGGDFPVPQAYKYRDYVIASFNADKPYDEFIKEQIAGDLLPAASEPEHWDHMIATGYLAGASTYDQAQIEDAVDNVGYAFLGTTLACARCHNHKFDPIPTSDYYAIAGILKSTTFPHAGNDSVRYQTGMIYRDPNALERPDIKAFQAQLKPIATAIQGVLGLPGTYDDLLPQLQRRRMDLYQHAPEFPESAYAVTEGTPLQAQIMIHGDSTTLGDEVPRGFLQVLGGGRLPADTKGSGRLELANWIASKDNPLTARVIVNRLWQGHFGRGIVATPNDFGTRGLPPSDQALLDYLATELVAKGWSIKAMQREMVLSHVYRLSTTNIAADEEIDPDNNYLWRHSRQRLDAEEVRDTLLADSQLLDRSPAGPHPFPPQSEWNWEEQNPFAPYLKKYENDRRTVYMMVQRSVKHPYMTLFDGADANASTAERNSSLTPLQALYFLNAALPQRCADHLAELLDGQVGGDAVRSLRVSGQAGGNSPDEKIELDRAFLLIYGRLPEKAERGRSMEFMQQMSARLAAIGSDSAKARQAALSHLIQAMFSSNEFMFVE
jgi:mono/diheme cytochrome c family protein